MDFPTISSYLESKQANWFANAVQVLEKAAAAGMIANPSFQDAKQRLNSALERAWGKFMDATVPHGDDAARNTRYALYDLRPQLHTVGAARKKLPKSGFDARVTAAVTTFLDEVAKLAELFEAVKPTVVKRERKEPGDEVPKYAPPPVTSTAMQAVKDLLDGITKDAYDAMLASFRDQLAGYVNQFLQAAADHAAQGSKEHLGAYDYYLNRKSKHYNREAYEITERCTEQTGRWAQATRRPDADATIDRMAKRNADEIREKFVYKNLKKLVAIIDAKGNYTGAQVLGRSLHMRALEGRIRITFADGSAFTVQNSVVWARSIHGTRFYRFPLTFHDVVMPDGSRMKQPSEERMNTLFVR